MSIGKKPKQTVFQPPERLKSLEAKEDSEELCLDLSNVFVATVLLWVSEGLVYGGAAQAVVIVCVHVLLSSEKNQCVLKLPFQTFCITDMPIQAAVSAEMCINIPTWTSSGKPRQWKAAREDAIFFVPFAVFLFAFFIEQSWQDSPTVSGQDMGILYSCYQGA